MEFQMNISSDSLRFKSLSTPCLKLNERWTYGHNTMLLQCLLHEHPKKKTRDTKKNKDFR